MSTKTQEYMDILFIMFSSQKQPSFFEWCENA